jgi:hypothetical protein
VGCECDRKFCYLKITHISIVLLLPDAIGLLLLSKWSASSQSFASLP